MSAESESEDLEFHKLEIRCRHAVEEMLAGEYLSVFKGRGIEFDEVRPYAPGDEIRTIDWNVTARTGEPFVKRFVEERDLTVWILIDISASKTFGSQAQTKRRAAAELAGLLAFSATANQDRVGMMLFTDQVEQVLEPGKGRVHVSRLLHDAMTFQPRSQLTNIREPLEMLMHIARRRAVVFVISDFQDSGYEETLQMVSRFHDLVAISVQDPHEKDLPSVGLIRVQDAETGKYHVVDMSHPGVRQAFQKRSGKDQVNRTGTMEDSGVDHFTVTVGGDYVGDMHAWLRARIQNRRGNHHG